MRRRAGLTQAVLARLVGVSRSTVWRVEHARLRRLDVDRAARIVSVLGGDVTVKVFPAGPPLRDAGHLALIDRMQRHISPVFARQFEAPLPIPGDPRALDQLLTLGGRRLALEYETSLDDVQELERRLSLKRRDGKLDRLILVVRGSARNRRILHLAGSLRVALPLSTHEVLRDLREGRVPPTDGIVFL